jgi:hypothetical protein
LIFSFAHCHELSAELAVLFLTGWTVTPKEATDDRLGLLVEVLGSDLERMIAYQIEQGAGMIQAWYINARL